MNSKRKKMDLFGWLVILSMLFAGLVMIWNGGIQLRQWSDKAELLEGRAIVWDLFTVQANKPGAGEKASLEMERTMVVLQLEVDGRTYRSRALRVNVHDCKGECASVLFSDGPGIEGREIPVFY